MITLNAIRARALRLEEKQAALAHDDYFLPPIDSYAFQFRLCLFEFTEGNPERVREQLESFHPKEIEQIMNLKESDWDAKSWIRIERVQSYIRQAQKGGSDGD